ncbi:RAB43, member RAS oncogene family protein [Cardiosporidium cionae]|uniref:RAB43, member RAS oncogene family protein n=1 Tax=Cardiosporidium cionae TaxID=476202 RepID=A0ABQ7J4W0_9APIC|nr:RAB43, member RAS oncogene family protein [Cardiosporidium cionae]|eukprot:KAF8819056.1 RAB43, member RAS oncogene family protein [Cardiosporidium cionae]
MARNSEKANAMLNKWLTMKQNVIKGVVGRRPRDVTECIVRSEAEKWRGQIIREVTRKISEIQNAGLGEHRIRDLNDEINGLLRQKHRWEERIIELGGPDYKIAAKRVVDAYGVELSGHGGYKYFGAAKDLPGVRELFERETVPLPPQRSRVDLYKSITPDYYGWRDEEDGELLLIEQQREKDWQNAFVDEWMKKEAQKKRPLEDSFRQTKAIDEKHSSIQNTTDEFKAYVDVPSTEDIQQLLLRKKKEALITKYLSTAEQKRIKETKELASSTR